MIRGISERYTGYRKNLQENQNCKSKSEQFPFSVHLLIKNGNYAIIYMDMIRNHIHIYKYKIHFWPKRIERFSRGQLR